MGVLIQQVVASIGSTISGTTAIPLDNTKPQSTEGVELLTCAITPTSATNSLLIEVCFQIGCGAVSDHAIISLFQDSDADALAVGVKYDNIATETSMCKITYIMTAGTTSETTFKVRGGCQDTSEFRINKPNIEVYNDTFTSSITISEIGI